MFPLIKLAKKLKESAALAAGYVVMFPLIKLAKKLKGVRFSAWCLPLMFPLIKLAKKLKVFIAVNILRFLLRFH